MGQQLKCKRQRNFLHLGFPKDDLLQKTRLLARGTGGAGQRIIYQVMQRISAMLVTRIFDLRDDFCHQLTAIDRLGM